MYSSFTTEQMAMWGAVLGTVSVLIASIGLIISLTTLYLNVSKARREAPKVAINKASAGRTFAGNLHWDLITAFAINQGSTTVSITGYGVEIYESRLGWLLSRPTRKVKGDGFDLRFHEGRVASALSPEKFPPLAIRSGEPMRLDIYDHGYWPDQRWRRVYVVVRYAPPSEAAARFCVVPTEKNFSDPVSINSARDRLLLGREIQAAPPTVVSEHSAVSEERHRQRPPHCYDSEVPPPHRGA